MAFRLDPSAPIPDEVRRLAREELEAAVAALREPDHLGLSASVHDARKRCKKVRGLLRLARPRPKRALRAADRGVRDAARAISPLRDAHATLATWDDLVAAVHGEDAPAPGLAQVRAPLAARASAAGGEDARERTAAAAGLLAEVAAGVGDWRIDDRPEALVDGMRRTYRDARRALRAAPGAAGDEVLHELRRQAKYGWHQVGLLHAVAPSVLAPLEARLKDLADALGDDHDLAVIRELVAGGSAGLGERAAADALAIIDPVRADLQDRALRLAARLYAETPTAFARRMAAYWEACAATGRERPAGELAGLAEEPADRPPTLATLGATA
ncbi:CHAD domain-containing protein [Miltoncostaea marina]|uniref:CHAD domain-containing protein n=1 Tax=Miltoncostaea marina TaxID=2843215 RepID=UPI001C3D6007|nr:CHAD domain-containing protein [Miltoncostaea marina]